MPVLYCNAPVALQQSSEQVATAALRSEQHEEQNGCQELLESLSNSLQCWQR